MAEVIRLDKWLWTARFYKTRNIASKAVDGGKVHVNQQRVKPSYRVKIGDSVIISRKAFKQEIIVSGVSSQRRSAKEVQALYSETKSSLEQRELAVMQRKILNQGLPSNRKKPGKHERQKIRQMLGKSK